MSCRRGFTRHVGLALTLLVIPTTPALAQSAPRGILGLSEALRLARDRSPLLQAAKRRIDEAHGDVTGASILLVANPELAVSYGPRFPGRVSEEVTSEIDVGFAQRLEIGGQRGYRMKRAEYELSATRADAANADRVVALAVAASFFDALAMTERLRLTEENERLVTDLLEVARSRVDQGAEALIVLSSARIRLAEARRKTIDARAERIGAMVRLVRLLGLPPGGSLVLTGTLPAASTMPPVEDLITEALTNRPDVIALSRRLDAARASAALARATAWPDLTVGVRYGLDQQDRLLLGTVGIGVPLFARNQGEREKSRAATQRIAAELDGLRLAVEGEIREAKARFDAAVAATAIYDVDVLRAQEESLVLLRSAYDAGKIDYTQLVLLQRELLEGRLGYLDARLSLAKAEAALRAAAGFDVAATGTKGGIP